MRTHRLLLALVGVGLFSSVSASAASGGKYFIRFEEMGAGRYRVKTCQDFGNPSSVCMQAGDSGGYTRAELDSVLTPAVAREIVRVGSARTRREVMWIRESLRLGKLQPFPCPARSGESDDSIEIAGTAKYFDAQSYRDRYGSALISCRKEIASTEAAPCVEPPVSYSFGNVIDLARLAERAADEIQADANRSLLNIEIQKGMKSGAYVSTDSFVTLTNPRSANENINLLVRVKKPGEGQYEGNFNIHSLRPGESARIPLQLGPGSYKLEIGDVVPGTLTVDRNGHSTASYYPKLEFQVENQDWRDRRGLLPSLFAQSGDPQIRALARSITEGLKGSRQKVQAIHDWVVDNLNYTLEISSADAVTTLRNKKSLCEGYANLTAALLRAVGVPTLVVLGKGKIGDNTWVDHAWNEVKIDGTWYAMDPTFDDPTVGLASGMNSSDEAAAIRAAKESARYVYFLKPLNDFPDHKRQAVTFQ